MTADELKSDFVIEFSEICKAFPGVQALDSVSFAIRQGEVHALVGENGAGKTTLINIASGALQPDSGRVLWMGREVSIPGPRAAQDLGISTVHQEMNLCHNLTVAGNVFMGREIVRANGTLDWQTMNAETAQLMEMLQVSVDPRLPVSRLKVSEQQLTEIAKALGRQTNLLIMDEPTSALTEHETNTLFETIRRLKAQGVSVLYVSHRLEEIFRIADRVSVLRDGQYIGTLDVAASDIDQIIRMMVGRELIELSHEACKVEEGAAPLLKVTALSDGGLIRAVDFQVNCGEILGFFGLQGSGTSEVVRSLFGLMPVSSGTVAVDGKVVRIKSPADAIRNGFGFVPSDRRGEGIVPLLDLKSNIAMVNLDAVSRFGFLNRRKFLGVAQEYRERLDIVSSSLSQEVSKLSGGNQQKVILARWLAAKPRLLIMEHPTRGIDVGAKAEIYEILNELAGEGLGIIMVSSELPEILRMSDRIIVMYQGRITGRFSSEEATAEKVMACATRGTAVEANSHAWPEAVLPG